VVCVVTGATGWPGAGRSAPVLGCVKYLCRLFSKQRRCKQHLFLLFVLCGLRKDGSIIAGCPERCLQPD
jgi:hypothetical protein